MATAIFLFVFKIVGVGPPVIGLASDTMFAGHGARSLGFAILMVQLTGILGGVALLAGRQDDPPEPYSSSGTSLRSAKLPPDDQPERLRMRASATRQASKTRLLEFRFPEVRSGR
ncbi:hypothetical protein [Nitratireductor mangrovi]|nr:hypothetical protein [Nitratireductor mangrovi]